MSANSMGVGLILVSILMALSVPTYPQKYQDKLFDLAEKIAFIGATLVSPSVNKLETNKPEQMRQKDGK
jgi:hypothetical protein